MQHPYEIFTAPGLLFVALADILTIIVLGVVHVPDLQLAAELGKTLLERNMELEEELRNTSQAQNEQALEIDVINFNFY